MRFGALPVVERDILVFRRELLGEIITTAASPLTYVVIFGMGLGGYLRTVEGMPYMVFLVPGLVAMAAVQSALDDAAWGLWFHRVVAGTINEYRVNPITTYDIIIGKILSGFFKASFKGLIVAALLLAFTGFRTDPWHLPAYVLFLLMGSAIFSCIGTTMGTLIDQPERLGQVEVVVVMPLVLLSGVFFPLSSYPTSLLPFITVIPTTAIFEGARQALLHGVIEPRFLTILVITVILAFGTAVYLFDRRLSD